MKKDWVFRTYVVVLRISLQLFKNNEVLEDFPVLKSQMSNSEIQGELKVFTDDDNFDDVFTNEDCEKVEEIEFKAFIERVFNKNLNLEVQKIKKLENKNFIM